MFPKEVEGRKLSAAERLGLAGAAGCDGVDFDQAGDYTPERARDTLQESAVFVHNAINHTHRQQRLTNEKEENRDHGRANMEHCLQISHAVGGNAVLIVVGQGTDGPAEIIEEQSHQEITELAHPVFAYFS